MVVKQLVTDEQFIEAYPVMHELRIDLTKEAYLELVKQMVPQGYRLYGLYIEEKIVALAGVIQLVNFYQLKHLYVYDLVTKASHRSKGYGENLLTFIHQLAEEENCHSVVLTSGFNRVDAHRFYQEKMKYEKTSYAFCYKL